MTLTSKPSTPLEIGGIGHSVKRHEDDRLRRGTGRLPRRPLAARHAAHGDPALAGTARADRLDRLVRRDARSTASSPWSPANCSRNTASRGCRRCRATRRPCSRPTRSASRARRSQRSSRPIRTSRRMRSSSSTSTTTCSRPSSSPQQSLADGTVLIRDDKEGQTSNLVYEWESGDAAATDAAFAQADRVVSIETHYPRSHPAPLETCGVLADVNSTTGPGDDLHDVASTARDPHRLRHGRRPARTEHPHHQPRPRRRLRQQGAGVPRLRDRDRGVARDRAPGEVDRDAQREPDLHRVRARLLHEGRARASPAKAASSRCA